MAASSSSSSSGAAAAQPARRRGGGGVLQELGAEGGHEPKEPEVEPQPGVVLKLAEVSGCDMDACYAALVACDGDFHGALGQLRAGILADEGGAKARVQMRAALQLLEQARIGRSVARGALGGAWIAAALLLQAFELLVPRRFLEIYLALLGVRTDGPLGLVALLLPPLGMILVMVLLLRDLDILLSLRF